MKKKNGFLAVSIIFSFFIVFLMLIVINMTSYAQNRLYMNQVKQDIKKTIDLRISNKSRDCTSATCPLCVRAVSLHAVKCENSICESLGYTEEGSKKTDIIEYGKLGATGATPAAGDAYDCDINGDKHYDSRYERFYYVSKLYNPNTAATEDSYATLIYYSNISSGQPDLVNTYPYSETASSGPVNAIKNNLPTAESDYFKRSGLSLYLQQRQIRSYNGGTTYGPSFLYRNEFDQNYVARLITHQEIKTACGAAANASTFSLNNCIYLMENTDFDEDYENDYVQGYWLETASSTTSSWTVNGNSKNVKVESNTNDSVCGIRPAIDVHINQLADSVS